MSTHDRVPPGSPTGGQFAPSTRSEAAIALCAGDSNHGVEFWPGSEFPREWPRTYEADRQRATVRTTNGGEISGILISHGTTYPIDVLTDDGRYIPILSWRVAGVRLDEPVDEDGDSQGR